MLCAGVAGGQPPDAAARRGHVDAMQSQATAVIITVGWGHLEVGCGCCLGRGSSVVLANAWALSWLCSWCHDSFGQALAS